MIETERMILRRWKPSDIQPFFEINSDSRVMEFYPSTNSLDETKQIVEKIEKSFDENRFGLFAVEKKSDKSLMGFVGLQRVPFKAHFTPAVEIGWRIGFEYWNQGYATEAARNVLTYGFDEIKLKEIVAMTVSNNTRSRRVMDKLGMIHDTDGDFENPKIKEGHPLRKHVLYRLRPTT